MRVLYGQRGQPAGSIDGYALFSREGEQIAELIGGYIYKTADGEWMGSIVSGVVFNVHGAPQAFTKDCEEVLLPPLEPALRTSLPVPLPLMGRDVRGWPASSIPKFLLEWMDGATRMRDGIFA